MFKASLVFVLAFLFALPLFAQTVDTAWVRRYNGPGNGSDAACAIIVDASGNVYVTGTSYGSVTLNDYATIKYYPNGDTAWVRRYNGPGNSSDTARAMALDPSGYIYVTGTSGTVKYDAQGNQLWVDILASVDIALDGLGNVYTTGIHWDGTQYNCITVKYNSDGSIAWADTLVNYYARALTAGYSSDVYVVGLQYPADYFTIKYYPNGDTAWVRTYDGPSHTTDGAMDVAADDFGNVYVTGTSEESKYGAGPDDDIATIKYDTDGNEEWVRRYDGAGYDDHGTALAIDHSGNVWVAGDVKNKLWGGTIPSDGLERSMTLTEILLEGSD